MKKVLAVAALLGLTGAAQAQVSVYGLIDMSYGQNQIASPNQKADFFSGGDNGSSQGNSTTRVGLKGSTDVGSGFQANFKLETNGITSNGDVPAPFFNRQAWAGLSGSFGEVRLGKQDSVAFQTMVGFDLNGAANAASSQQNAWNATWLGADPLSDNGGRQARSLQYISPVRSGFKLQVGYQPAGNGAVDAENNASIGLTYTADKLAVAYTGETKRVSGGNNFNAIAGTYDFGVVKAMLGYSDGGTNQKGLTAGVVAPVAGYNIGLNYSRNSDTSVGATEIFVNKEIFKGTYAYFDYGNLSNSNAVFTKGDAYALGVIYTF